MSNKKPVPIWKNVIKPCLATGFCPYGTLVEEFPIELEKNERSCDVFGHDCPVFYVAEPVAEEGKFTDENVDRMFKEFEEKSI